MQPPQYPYQPPQPARRNLWRWYRGRGRFAQIGIGCATIIVALLACATCSGVLAATGHNPLFQPTSTSQPVTNVSPTTAATLPPAATKPPTATPKRSGPTRSQIDDFLNTSALEATVTSYNQGTATLVLSTGFGYKVAVTQSAVKGAMQDTQTAFWQKGWYFSSLTLNVVQFQQSGSDLKIGSCVLKYATASAIDWNNPGDLWTKYDQKSIDATLPA
jgi:hypothetical protein